MALTVRRHLPARTIAASLAGPPPPDRHAPATLSVRDRALQQFFTWAVAEEELDRFPMDAMHAPVVPEHPVDMLPTPRTPTIR